MPTRHVPARLLARIVHGLLIASLVFALVPGMGRAAAPDPAELCKDGLYELAKTAIFTAVKTVGGGTFGKAADEIDAVVLDPIVAYYTHPDEEALGAVAKEMFEAGVDIYFPAFGIAIQAGKVVVGGTAGAVKYTLDQLIQATREQTLEAVIFGTGVGGLLARVNNPLRDVNFFSIGALANKGITPESFGQKVTSSEQLNTLWFTQYRNVLVNDLLFNKDEVDKVLAEAWPRLDEYWRLKRAAAGLEAFRTELERQLRTGAEKAKTLPCAPTPGGLYRGQIPGETSVPLENWGGPPELKALVLHTFSAEIRIDPTSQPAADGVVQNQVTGGAMAMRSTITHENDTSGTWLTEESFTSSIAEGTLSTSPDGTFGLVTFTGEATILSSTLSSGGPQSATVPFPFGYTIDDAGQLRLCSAVLQAVDLKTASQACAATSFLTLQPVVENVPV